MRCFLVQSYFTLSETDQTLDKWLSTILLILRPLSWSNSLWAGPTLNEQLDSFSSSPPLLRQRCNQWAPSSREERRVFLLSKNKHATATKSQGKGQEGVWKENESIYKYKDYSQNWIFQPKQSWCQYQRVWSGFNQSLNYFISIDYRLEQLKCSTTWRMRLNFRGCTQFP